MNFCATGPAVPLTALFILFCHPLSGSLGSFPGLSLLCDGQSCGEESSYASVPRVIVRVTRLSAHKGSQILTGSLLGCHITVQELYR